MFKKTMKRWRQLRKRDTGNVTHTGKVKTSGYESFGHNFWQQPRDLPPFDFTTVYNMLFDPQVRLALNVRSAPLFGTEWAYKETEGEGGEATWKPGVQARKPEVAQFVLRQLERIWRNHLHEIVDAQKWGWAAGEIVLKLGPSKLLEFHRFESRKADDCRLLVSRSTGEPDGVEVKRAYAGGGGSVNLWFPEAFFHAHNPEPGQNYGSSVLLGCYSPWADKWLEGGALDVRRLFMHKDAYGGVHLGYPDGVTNLDGYDNEVPNRDIARQIVEQIRSGNTIVTPSERDENGNDKWPIERAHVAANPAHILQFPKDLDGEIRVGIGVPDGIIDDDGSGGLGDTKKVAMAAFYATLDTWVIQIVSDLTEQIFEELVRMNFGQDEEFQITHKPLALQAMEQQAAQQPQPAPGMNGPGEPGGMFGQPGSDLPAGAQPPTQLPDTSRQDAARLSLSGALRMAAAHAPVGGITINGTFYPGGQFIPGDVVANATAEEKEELGVTDDDDDSDDAPEPVVKPKKKKKPFAYRDGKPQAFDEQGMPVSSEATFEAAIETGADPREAATASAVSADADAEYEFARPSSIGNAGDDLKGSARHRVNYWRGLEDAEKDGTAEKIVKRDSLLKLEPINLEDQIEANPLASLSMYYAMRSFPAKPGKRRGGNDEAETKNRRQYLEAYRSIKEKAEELANDTGDGDTMQAISGLQKHVKGIIDELRGGRFHSIIDSLDGDRFNQTANDLVNMYKLLHTQYGRSKTSVKGRMNLFAKSVQDKYGKAMADIDDTTEMREVVTAAGNHARDIIEGRSLNKTFGIEAKKTNRFKPADVYVKHATRTGGRDMSAVTADANRATNHMVEELGFRGVQWGNSVTDDERQHHAEKLVESFADLSDVLGIHPGDISLDGVIGMAIGARGRGGASAHYEPGTKVINLTRASGVGALAHEWGHAFDHLLGDHKGYMAENSSHSHEVYRDVDPDGRTWPSNGEREAKGNLQDGWSERELPKAEIRKAYQALTEAQKPFRKRLNTVLIAMVGSGQISRKKAMKYWASGREVFARCFEVHVKHALEGAGRGNTYLTGLDEDGGGLWPNSEESKSMAPHFDKIFAAYRKEKYGSEDIVKMSLEDRRAWFRLSSDDCGANKDGGGGFVEGNTCAGGAGDTKADKPSSKRAEAEQAIVDSKQHDDRGKKGSVTKRAGLLLSKLEKKPWQTPDEVTAKSKDGSRNVPFSSKQIMVLKKLGYLETAWDKDGYSHYAPPGEALPEWLTQSDNDDALAELPAKPAGPPKPDKPKPKTTRKKKPTSKTIKWATGNDSTRLGMNIKVDSAGNVLSVEGFTDTRTRKAKDIAPTVGENFKDWQRRVGGKSHTVRGSIKTDESSTDKNQKPDRQ